MILWGGEEVEGRNEPETVHFEPVPLPSAVRKFGDFSPFSFFCVLGSRCTACHQVVPSRYGDVCPFMDCPLNTEQGQSVSGDKTVLYDDPPTEEDSDQSMTSLAQLKEYFFENMPYAEEEVEEVEEVHFDFDTLYPSQFPRSSSRRKNVRYSPKLEAVVFKYVKEWSDQAEKSLGGIKEILPKRTAFYRAVHTSLEGLPGLSRLENDLARNPEIKASTSVALFWSELAQIVSYSRNIREFLSFLVYAVTALQLQAKEKDFVPVNYELWVRSVQAIGTCAELATKNCVAIKLSIFSQLRAAIAEKFSSFSQNS